MSTNLTDQSADELVGFGVSRNHINSGNKPTHTLTCKQLSLPVHEQHLSSAGTEVSLGVGHHSNSLKPPAAFHSSLHNDIQEHALWVPIVYSNTMCQ